MTDAPQADTWTVTVAGTEIWLKPLTSAQVVVLHRIGSKIGKEKDLGKQLDLAGLFVDIIDSLVIAEEQRQFLLNGMATGTVTLEDLGALLTSQPKAAPVKAAKKATSRVRRSR